MCPVLACSFSKRADARGYYSTDRSLLESRKKRVTLSDDEGCKSVAYRGGPLQSGVSKPRGVRRWRHNVTQVAHCMLRPSLFKDVRQVSDRHEGHLAVLLLLGFSCCRRARGSAPGSVRRGSYHAAPLTDVLCHATRRKLTGRQGTPH